MRVAATLALAAAGCTATPRLRRREESLLLPPGTLARREDDRSRSAEAARPAVAAMNAFGWRLLTTLARESPRDNILVSGPAAYLPLGLATEGARGLARAALATRLALPPDPDSTAALFRYLTRLELAGQFRLAAALWVRPPDRIAPEFRERCRGVYPARLAELEGSAQINDWGRRSSGKRFSRIVTPEDLAIHEPGLLVTSLAHFADRWLHPFAKAEAPREPMLFAPSLPVGVAQLPGATAVRLPYASYRTAFIALLPDASTTPESVVAALAAGRAPGTFRQTSVRLALPRFTLEERLELHRMLPGLGLAPAFDGGRKDFTWLGAGRGGLCRFWQRVRFGIEEGGSGISGGIPRTTAGATTNRTIRFERPFVVQVVENETGAILLCGIVRDPNRPPHPTE